MAGELGQLVIPISGSIDPSLLATVNELIGKLNGTATAAEKSTVATEKHTGAWERGVDRLNRAADTFNEVHQAVSTFVGRLAAAAEEVVNLAAEQDRLDRTSDRLGLDFERAAQGAGRFVPQVEAMTVASQLAESGLRLTQDELDQVTRRAAILAQNLGTDTRTAFQQLFAAVQQGDAGALRPLGDSMVRLAGDGHTASERLSELVRTSRGMATATDDARTSMERYRAEIAAAQRTFASGFVDQLLATQRALERGRDTTLQWSDYMDAFGRTAATVVQTLRHLFFVLVDTVGTAMAAVATPLRNLAMGLWELGHGNFQAAWGQLTDTSLVRNQLARLRQSAEETGDAWFTARQPGADDGPLHTPRGGGPGPNAMVFTLDEVTAQNRTAARAAGGGGRGGARAFVPGMTFSEAEVTAADAADRARLEGPMTRATGGMTFEEALSGRRPQTAEEAEAATNDAAKTAAAERANAADKERARVLASERSLTEQLRTQFAQRATAAQTMAGSIRSAYDTMTKAAGDHLAAFLLGQESLGAALQGMLRDTLVAITKEASVKAILELAEGIAALARYQYDAAGEHFAAMAAYGAVAAVAGAGSQLLAPSTGGAAAGAGGPGNPAGKAALTEPSAAQPAKSTGPTQVTIVYGSGVLSTPRDLARHVAGVLNAGVAQGRVELDPRLLARAGR